MTSPGSNRLDLTSIERTRSVPQGFSRRWSTTGCFLCVLVGLAGCASSSPSPCEPATSTQTAPVGAEPTVKSSQTEAPAQVELSLWEDGPSRKAIEDFVARVTDQESPDYVPPEARIATFDNDGTLWSEQPMYVQLAFALDRIKELAPEHPEWKTQQPYKAALEGDLKTLSESGAESLVKLIVATHAGVTTDEFERIAVEWLTTAQHPKYKKPYTDLTYAPMIELLAYLRAHGFATYIISAGGEDFMRPWAKAAYGIPPEQVFGSRLKLSYEVQDGSPVIVRKPEMRLVNDASAKPLTIHEGIGKRPIFAGGNSDGDLQMLQWTHAQEGPSLSLLVHHTDDVRETAYDKKSAVGKLDEALDLAQSDGWLIVDMKADWKKVFSFQESDSSEKPNDASSQ